MNIGGNNIQPQNVTAREDTRQGTLAVPISFDLTMQNSVSIDLTPLQNERKFISVQCIYADNSANTESFSITMADTRQTVTWPAGSQGYINVISTNNIKFVATTLGSVIVDTQFLNYEQGTRIWQPVASSSGGGDVVVTNVPLPVQGTVSVGNFPGTQPVSGSVAVANFPATQPVSGSVAVSNFPATQPVSGSVSISPNVALNAYSAFTLVPPTAGAMGYSQLRNPVGSGVNIILSSILLVNVAANLVTQFFAWAPTTSLLSGGSGGLPYHSGAAISKGLVASSTTTTVPAFSALYGLTQVAVSSAIQIDFDEPIIITPGNAFYTILFGGNGLTLSVTYQWTEQ